MPRKVAPRRVANLQRTYLQRMGATPQEIRRFRPILTAQIGAESNFTQGIGSPAGARDIAQFMPGTAPGYGVKLGDNRIKDDIRGQVRYMLPLLRKYGVEGALRGYNAGVGAIERSHGFSETNNYVSKILGSADQYGDLAGSLGGGGGSPGRATVASSAGGVQLADLIAQLQVKEQQPRPSGSLPDPAFSARKNLAMPAGAAAFDPGQAPAPPQSDTLAELLAAVQTQAGGMPEVRAGDAQNAGSAGGGGGGKAGPRGQVTLSPNADRAGVRTRPHILNFLERVAGIVGGPLTVGTGSRHSQMTASGNVSDHWTGRGADVPLSGNALTRAGRAALVAAGMSEREAAKAKGGIYNLSWNGRRVQVIFNADDHWDHLHVGISARGR